jgi:hypothetical protein
VVLAVLFLFGVAPIWRSLLNIAHADDNLRADAPAART